MAIRTLPQALNSHLQQLRGRKKSIRSNNAIQRKGNVSRASVSRWLELVASSPLQNGRCTFAPQGASRECRVRHQTRGSFLISFFPHRVKAKSARELRAEAFEKRLGLGKKEDRSILKKNVKLTIGKVGEEEMSVSLESENDEEVESEDGYASVLQVQGVDQKIDELASSDSGDGGPVLMTGRDLVKFGIEHGQFPLTFGSKNHMLISLRDAPFRSFE